MHIYAISDPHGCLDLLECAVGFIDLEEGNQLILLGDYVPYAESCADEDEFFMKSAAMLAYVRELYKEHDDKVVALMGNHEFDIVHNAAFRAHSLEPAIRRWLRGLPLFHETERQVFVHAGIDEGAGDLWRWGTPDEVFLAKYPLTFGSFEKDIISGHVSARSLAHDSNGCSEVFWDGASHYVIDGATAQMNQLPILRYDTITSSYDYAIVTPSEVRGWRAVTPADYDKGSTPR